MTTVISIIVAVGLVGFIIGAAVYGIKTGDIKLLNTKEDFENYERDCVIPSRRNCDSFLLTKPLNL